MTTKAYVLLSGGVDSTTCLYKAREDFPDGEAVSIYYGQRHRKEIEYAAATCEQLDIEHTVLDVGKILTGAKVMLSEESRGLVEVPNISYSDIQGVSPTYVPFRNGTLLSAVTAHAQKWVNEDSDSREAAIYFGAHAEDAANWAYPDCTAEFIGAMANAIYIGSYQKIRLHTPIQWLMKHEVVALGHKLGVDFSRTWSCYKGEELHCGTCPTCRSRREAFRLSGIQDPTKYAPEPVAA